MTECDEWRWENWLLLVFHDDGEALEHPDLGKENNEG